MAAALAALFLAALVATDIDQLLGINPGTTIGAILVFGTAFVLVAAIRRVRNEKGLRKDVTSHVESMGGDAGPD